MGLDPIGNVSLSLQILIIIFLLLGLPFFRKQKSTKTFMLHGYSTVAALILHTVLIFIVMVPSFASEAEELFELSMFGSVTVWSHVILGTAAEVVGIILVVAWVIKGPSKMACVRWKKLMTPLLVIWVISIVNGALVHLLGLL